MHSLPFLCVFVSFFLSFSLSLSLSDSLSLFLFSLYPGLFVTCYLLGQINHLTMAGAQNDDIFVLYRYDPSMAAAVIFIIMFMIITALHVYQLVKTKTWFFICFVIGGFSKAHLSHSILGSRISANLYNRQCSLLVTQV